MLFAKRSLVVAVAAAVIGLASVGLAKAADQCQPCPPCGSGQVQVYLRTGTLVIVGSTRADVVTIRRFNGPTLGATATYSVYVNGSRRPVLTFPTFDLRTGRRVSHIFMDGNHGFDQLQIEDTGRWQINTRSVERRLALRPAN